MFNRDISLGSPGFVGRGRLGRTADGFHRRLGTFPAKNLQMFCFKLIGGDEKLFQFLSDGFRKTAHVFQSFFLMRIARHRK